MWYERRMPSLKYEGDEVPHMIRDYKRLLVDYALAGAWTSDDNPQKAISYRTAYEAGKRQMKLGLKVRDTSRNKTVEIVNDFDLYGS